MNPESLIATAEAARERLLADPIPTIAVRVSPTEARERGDRIVKHFRRVVGGPQGLVLTAEARAEFEALCAGLANDIDCYHGAELLLAYAMGPQRDAERVRLTTSNREWDKKLTPWTKTLFGTGPLKSVVDIITPGSGHKDDAEDVERHTDLLLKHLPLDVSIPWTADALKEAAKNAAAYLRMVDEGSPAEQEALLLCRKAYARAAANYRRLQVFGLALAWDEPEAAVWFAGFNTEIAG